MKLGNGRRETAAFNNRLQVTQIGLGTSYDEEYFLEDYIEVTGIKFPPVVRRGQSATTRTTYQVNVLYDKNLFKGVPRIDMGPNAWKSK
ncbi:hypothetical protein BH10ACI2_BH10ACI2_00500 [soil metagenome]